MSYLGKGLKSVSSANITVDTMIGDGVVNTLALSQNGVESVKDVSVYYQGVAQVPDIDYTLTASTVTFTSIPSVGMKVVVVTRGDSVKDKVNDNSVTGASFADNAITDSNIIGLDASKLTGALPAMDGSALTNKSIPTAPLISSASNPTNESNAILGDVWTNTTSGEMFVCTDATTDQNVWTNIGDGDGHITYTPPPPPFGGMGGGTISGYTSGGHAGGARNIIDKFSFVNPGNAVDVGDLTNSQHYGAGISSSTDGYVGGGYPSMTPIQKFSFVSGSCSVIGVLSHGRTSTGVASSTNGYSCGGFDNSAFRSEIDKFSFSSNGNASLVGQLITGGYIHAGQSSNTAGYISAGIATGSVYNNIVEKFLFATDGNTTNVGNLTNGGSAYTSGQSSPSYGYICAGTGGTGLDSMEKFSFATDGNTVNVANLTTSRYSVTGQSSQTHGYVSGGHQGGASNVIESFTFSVDAGGVDHGNLTVAREQVTGQQY